MKRINNIKISTCVISYNQENYIRQCLESVINQVTNFDFEVVIGDDCSTDKTYEICKEFSEKYPKKVKLLQRTNNMGMIGNWIDTISNCSGKYIALCEGDDFWTDNFKLQKQYDFLNSNQQLSFCFHKAYRFDLNNESRNKIYPENTESSILNAEEFFKIPTIPTASVVFINKIQFPTLIHSHADMMLYATLLSKGNAGFIMENMSAYRLHSEGISSKYGENWYLERRIKELNIERKYKDFSKNVRNQISTIYIDHILSYLNINRGKLSLKTKQNYLKELLTSKEFYKKSIKDYFRVFKIAINR